jgi:4-aminobutyrate aminotransferase/(S)-3-amino-2-methylpropionate transaminase
VADHHGIMLIVDEIQTGFGRTGKFFAIEHSGVQPDLITVAKSLAAGFPLSGVVGRAEVMDAPDPGGLGGTYGGNPVACAAGLAVMDIMRDEKLPERAARIGSVVEERMQSWAAEHELVGDVRVVGAMAGMELVRDRGTKEAADKETAKLLAVAREKGLIILRAGTYHNVIRTLMPLTIPDEHLEEGLDILGEALAEVAAGR